MRIIAAAILIALFTSHSTYASEHAASSADIWRTFAEKVEVGARITVRLQNGQRVSATLVQARPDALLIQPRTRVSVPVQPVPYDAIASIERDAPGGMSAAKAAAIGVATGAATFCAILLILLANVD